ncbi:hypothetical protein BYT27DRAFT_7090364 [Phlegmacium glaucopus]|nr:hypothetical protein BYT27DRAFT_7090364 [Phlegmacium glaucopus]
MPLPQTSIKSSIDLKANGEASRMRNHRGNMPSLPQTKCCALCPAKFTRTTHLNRHLRSHTNERAHRCTSCNAEFTRSDLLTRHKRTCGDARNANKSRRKSCQACAESKVKCDLEQPCSKCSAKGKECIFINDPGALRNKKGITKKRSASSASPSEGEASECSSGRNNPDPSSPSSMISHISNCVENLPHDIIPLPHPNSQFLSKVTFGSTGVPNLSDCSSAPSSRSSPRLDYFDSCQSLSNGFNTTFDTMDLDSDLHNFFPNALDPYMEDPFKFSPCLSRVQPEPDVSPWFEFNQACSAYGSGGPYVYSQPVNHDQIFVGGLTNLMSASFSKTSYSRQPFCSYSPVDLSVPTSAPAPGNPTIEELNQYLYLFFTEFSTQIPLFHRPTWKMESTHPLLVKAMRACGALFTKTMTATNFIISTLTSSRDVLLLEFSKPSCTLKDHISLMLAVVLLQSVGLLQPRPEQRSLTRMYHELLLMMIRKTGLIELIGAWSPPDLSHQASLETAWNDWARYETLKRTLVLAYLQDCSYCIYYSTALSLLGLEIEINLPCDDALWKAQTSAEWYKTQRTPSPYGTGLSRMLGANMQFALASLKDRGTSVVPYTVNPFASFILIHSILRDIFSGPSTRPAPGSNCMIDQGGIHDMNSVTIQCSLHNWQKMWSANPEAMRLEANCQGIPFVSNAIPFYWLARFAEAAKHSGTMPIGPSGSRIDMEDRYRLVKTWLIHITSCLRSGSQISPTQWNNPTAVGLSTYSDLS